MQLDEKNFLVNSTVSLSAFKSFSESLFQQHKWVTFSWRIGRSRTLDQNALFHVWLTEYAAHLLRKDKRDVTEAELEGMKLASKQRYYNETGADWMLFIPINPLTGAEYSKSFRSSRGYARGEMFQLLTRMQMWAAEDGLVLESKGEFQKLQEK